MECKVCGRSYSVTHDCEGVVTPSLSGREAAPIPTGFAPLYYARLAFGIMRWDDVSVRRASRDPRALLYGAFFWVVAATVVVSAMVSGLLSNSLSQSQLSGLAAVVFSMIVGIVILIIGIVASGLLTVAQLGLCHLIAKWFCGGTGTFVGILRPLSLGWPINLVALIPIPIVGPLAAGLLWAAVLMVVFEEVHHIRRVQAFMIAYGVNLAVLAVSRLLFS